MGQLSFSTNEKTDQALDDLKEVFGVSTTAEAIRQALTLARTIIRRRDKEENTVTILQKRDEKGLIDPPREIVIDLGL